MRVRSFTFTVTLMIAIGHAMSRLAQMNWGNSTQEDFLLPFEGVCACDPTFEGDVYEYLITKVLRVSSTAKKVGWAGWECYGAQRSDLADRRLSSNTSGLAKV